MTPPSSQRGPAFFHRRYNRVEADSSYAVNISFFISPTLLSGSYNLSVHTDSRNQVFELTSDDNNMRSMLVIIRERFPDLVVRNFSYTVEPTIRGNVVRYSYMVQNDGAGETIGAPWLDQLSISPSPVSNAMNVELQSERHLTELAAGLGYSANRALVLPTTVHGSMYLYLTVDSRNQIVEESVLNNVLRSIEMTIAPLFPDLEVQNLNIISSSLVGGESAEFEWSVINRGELVILPLRWYDSVYLSQTENLADAVKLADVIVSNGDSMLEPQMTYQHRAVVTLPLLLDYTVTYHILLLVNSRQQFDENGRLANNLESIVTELSPPPAPDLQVRQVSSAYFPSSRILTVQWVVRNAGNTMGSAMSWRDQILLSPEPSFNPTRNIILGHRDQSQRLVTDQTYTLRESFFVPSTAIGEFYVYVMTDVSNSVMEIDGEENNILRSDDTFVIAEQPTITLDISVNTDILPSSYFTGQSFAVEYTVRNSGGTAVGATSWVDGVYLSSVANPSRSFLLSDGLLIAQTVNNMELERDGTYRVMINVTLPYELTGQPFLAILIDMNDVLNIQTVGTLGSIISIDQSPLPDLTVSPISNDLNITSGQPAIIEYAVENVGVSEAAGLWYEAVFLSRDAEHDPFDTRLRTVSNLEPGPLRANESYNQSIEVFIPYDLPTSFYYIIILVDTRNDLFEESVDNNEGSFVVFITEAVSTDLLVLGVQVSPASVTYGDLIDYRWRLRNNGSLQAIGYKCDSIYLSEDDLWDISDYELGLPQCGGVTVNAFSNTLGNDRSYSHTAVTPFVAQRDYYGIVRTRTNIRDPNLSNNIGSSTTQIELNAPSITLGRPTTISLDPRGIQVFRIDGVPGEETLVASLTTEQPNVYHNLYVRHREAPTGAQHDAFSQFSLSSFQRAVVRHSRSGAYYLRVESFTNSDLSSTYDVEILVKIAQFEVLDVTPTTAAPLGNVTIRITGTVLSYFSSATLVSYTDNLMYPSIKVYWFSSESIYATFDLAGTELGEYSVHLTDEKTGSVAQLNDSFTIATGIPGRLTVNVQPPRALRSGEVGDVMVQIRNTGNTDLLSPHLVLVTRDQAIFRLLDDSGPIDFTDQIDFLGLSLEGPAGILAPGTSTQVNFRVAQLSGAVNQARFGIRIQNNASAPHAYLNRKSSLRPVFTPTDVWDTIWENFIRSVGTTQQTFTQRISEIASEFSLVGKRTYSVQDLVQYQLKVAFGLLSGIVIVVNVVILVVYRAVLFSPTGDTIMSLDDLFDENDASFFPLVVVRTYSAYIHKRRTVGPMGAGWLLDLWCVERINLCIVII